jgi:hypothetical protein
MSQVAKPLTQNCRVNDVLYLMIELKQCTFGIKPQTLLKLIIGYHQFSKSKQSDPNHRLTVQM